MTLRTTTAFALLAIASLSAKAAAQTSAADYIAAIEGPQEYAGEDGLGELSVADLMKRFNVPGVSVAVIRDFEIHWARGYGIADVETGAPVDTETVFQAASISKPVAAMAVLRAVQDGLFTLDDDINDILVSWTLDGEGFTTEQPVTPRGLTSHTSGLGDGFGFPGYDPADPVPTVVQVLEGEEPSNTRRIFMERPPLSLFEYSGGGVTLMQLALSDARGRPFADILRDDVLRPIGMVNSTYEQPLPPERDRNAARAHDREGRSRRSGMSIPRWRPRACGRRRPTSRGSPSRCRSRRSARRTACCRARPCRRCCHPSASAATLSASGSRRSAKAGTSATEARTGGSRPRSRRTS
jgi:CubicO group peptidase (beta-lactamase class C family)